MRLVPPTRWSIRGAFVLVGLAALATPFIVWAVVPGPDWGSVADWYSGVGATGALIAAIAVIELDRRERAGARQQARRAQASKISANVGLERQFAGMALGESFASIESPTGELVVKNNSDEPIFYLVAAIRDERRRSLGTLAPIRYVPGRETVINDLPDPILRQVGEGTSLHARYSFVDAAGVAWDRDNWTGALIERPAPAWEEPVDESTAGEAD